MTSVLTLNLSNKGLGQSGIVTVSVGGPDAAAFALGTDNCTGKRLLAGERCSFEITFQPMAAGTPAATVEASATPGGKTTTTLMGTALAPGAVQVTPALHDYTFIAVAGTADFAFQAKNTGGVATGALALKLSGSDAGQFSIMQDLCSTKMLAPSDTCTFTVRFAPTSVGTKAASVLASAMPGGAGSATLQGTGSGPVLSWTPSTMDFGTVDTAAAIGPNSGTVFTLKNDGNANSGNIVLTPGGPNSGDFHITADNCSGAPVTALSSCTIKVAFGPGAVGPRAGTLTANATPGSSPPPALTLTGNGIDRLALTVAPSGTGSGNVTSTAGTPGSINCGSTCSSDFYRNSMVTLAAVADPTADFNGWTVSDGSTCAGTGPCTVTMNAAKTVTATFTAKTATVPVTLAGAGSGNVTSSPAGFTNCTTNCTATFNQGASVVITATPASNSYVSSWTGCTSTQGASCNRTVGATNPITVTFTVKPANFMFVTSTSYAPGFLGGVSAANTKCGDRAKAAGLGGTYVAWLATTGTPAINALTGSRGWVRRDLRPFIDQTSDIAAIKILYPPRLDEFGNDKGPNAYNFPVITGADANGNLAGVDCAGWTNAGSTGIVATGDALAGGDRWTYETTVSCGTPLPIYCFGTGMNVSVAPPAPTGKRIAFRLGNAQSWNPASGRGTADTLCTNVANAATPVAFAGTFHALLASSGGPAVDRTRFPVGGPWFRPDGVQIVAADGDLFSTMPNLLAPINLDEKGIIYGAGIGVMTGAADPITNGTDATTCGNWASTAGFGTSGEPVYSSYAFMARHGSSQCNSGQAIWCLQQ